MLHTLIVPSWCPASPNHIGGSFFREQAIALAKRGIQVGVSHPSLRSLRRARTLFTGPYGMHAENDQGVQAYRSNGVAWFPRMQRLSRWYWMCHGIRLFEQ